MATSPMRPATTEQAPTLSVEKREQMIYNRIMGIVFTVILLGIDVAGFTVAAHVGGSTGCGLDLGTGALMVVECALAAKVVQAGCCTLPLSVIVTPFLPVYYLWNAHEEEPKKSSGDSASKT